MDRINELLDRLGDLSEAELSELEALILSTFSELEGQEPTGQTVDSMTQLADSLDSVRSELTRRTELEAELKAKAEEASSRIKKDTTTDEVVEEDVEVDVTVDEVDPETGEDIESDSEEVVETEDSEDEEDMKKKGKPFSADEPPTDASVEELSSQEQAEEATTEAATPQESELSVEDSSSSDGADAAPEAPEAELAVDQTVEAATEVTEGAEASVSEDSTNNTPEAELATASDDDTTTKEEGMTASTGSPEGAITPPASAAPVARTPEGLGLTITAGADIPGFGAGQKLSDMREVSEAFAKRLHTLSNVMGNEGQRYNIASLGFEYPEDRRLNGDDSENYGKISNVTSVEALTAAAGVCAPLETIYDINVCGDTDRPIRDALARFNADRGGVKIWGSPSLGTGGVGIWAPTAASSKTCAAADCPTAQEIYLEAIYNCVCFNNFTNRFFPEVVKANTDLSMIAHAKTAELNMLKKIKANSTDVDARPWGATGMGLTRQLVRTVLSAAALLRRKHRLASNAPMRVILPSWVRDAVDADLVQQMPGDGLDTLVQPTNKLDTLLGHRGINVTWSLDSWLDDGSGESPNTVNGTGFDATVGFPMYPEGTFLFLDGGTLDLGVTRDKTSIAANEYCTFVETFENVAKTGCESLWIRQNVCVSGAAAALVAGKC